MIGDKTRKKRRKVKNKGRKVEEGKNIRKEMSGKKVKIKGNK